MKKLLSITMAILMIVTTLFALPFTAQAKTFYCGKYGTHEFDSLDELKYLIEYDNCDSNDAAYILTKDIDVNDHRDITIALEETQGNTDRIIDLNGHNITVNSNGTTNLFDVTGRHHTTLCL